MTVIWLKAGEPENQLLTAHHDLFGHPAFAVIDGEGKVVQRLPGTQTETVLRKAIATFWGENG